MLVPEPCDQEDVVERQRESSGHAPRAGVGDVSGDGESHRKDGGCSFAVAIFANCKTRIIKSYKSVMPVCIIVLLCFPELSA